MMHKLDFNTAFKYPFNRSKGMLNIFWILLPIIGWFALGGYGVRIVKEFSKGKFKKLPTFKFGDDFKLGFFMFLKALPFIIVYGLLMGILGYIDEWLKGSVELLLEILVVPILTINFMNKQTVGSFFEFSKIRYVFENFADYIVAILKSILLFIVFLVMVIVLVGIPAMAFTNNIFLADFYRRNVK
jgi:hypothetical protein